MQTSTHYCQTCDLTDGPTVYVSGPAWDQTHACEYCATLVEFDMRETAR